MPLSLFWSAKFSQMVIQCTVCLRKTITQRPALLAHIVQIHGRASVSDSGTTKPNGKIIFDFILVQA